MATRAEATNAKSATPAEGKLFDVEEGGDSPGVWLGIVHGLVATPSPDLVGALVVCYARSRLALTEIDVRPNGPNPGTLRVYRDRARTWGAWAALEGVRLDSVSDSDLRRFAVHLFRQRLRTAYVRQHLVVARMVSRAVSWAGVACVPPRMPCLEDPVKPEEKRSAPSWHAFRAALERLRVVAFRESNIANLRLLAALQLLGVSGLRKSEALGALWSDVDVERRVIRVRVGKGGRTREVPVSRGTLATLERLRSIGVNRNASEHFGNPAPGWEPILSHLDDPSRRLSPQLLHRLVAAWSEAEGISGEGACHRLRHAAFTEMARQGVPLQKIRDIAGHRSIVQTEQYAKRAQAAELVDAVDGLDE